MKNPITTTIYHQLSSGVRMNLGARDFVSIEPDKTLMFRIGSSRVVRKAFVTLDASDTYTVRIGRMDRQTLDWIEEAERSLVYVDKLGDTLIRMHDEVTR